MYTTAELQMLRDADPGVVVPGIDTTTGNLLPLSSLTSASQITQNPNAPYFYDPTQNRVVVTQAGAVLSGIDFNGVLLAIKANNVTVEDCSFQAGPSQYYCIQQYASASGTVVQNNTFTGGSATNPLELAAFIAASTKISVLGNSFINAPGDGVDLENGVVSGNYFSGAGYSSVGVHPDAIWVGATTGPVSITNNFIDATNAAGATGFSNGATVSAVRITTELGNTSNVSVTGNILLGGTYTVNAGVAGSGTFSNIKVTNNFIGFGQFGAFYGPVSPGTTESGNTVFDFTDSAYSTAAWAAYCAAGLPTAGLVISSGGSISAGAGAGPTTLYGAGNHVQLYGGSGETNFVGGAGTQYLWGEAGANIFTELAISNSTANSHDDISNFDSAKDVIDLSRIDANLSAAGMQQLNFIGTAAFSGGGAQVRYQQDPTLNVTYVQADLAGNSSPDLVIQISGLQTLTAANFALTAAQSTTDMANGASLGVSATRLPGGLTDYHYTNVQGRSYSSFDAFYTNNTTRVADDLNISATTNELDLYGNTVTVSRGSGTESLITGTHSFTLGYHASETINASAAGAETFALSTGFGNETITGFSTLGTNADTVQFAASAFSYLNASMTQAQDLAAVLVHTTSGTSGITIADSHGDSLTLAGVTASTIAANPGQFHFV